ncbi:hypothetical protein Tco_0921397 [Tanacetum coccineum]
MNNCPLLPEYFDSDTTFGNGYMLNVALRDDFEKGKKICTYVGTARGSFFTDGGIQLYGRCSELGDSWLLGSGKTKTKVFLLCERILSKIPAFDSTLLLSKSSQPSNIKNGEDCQGVKSMRCVTLGELAILVPEGVYVYCTKRPCGGTSMRVWQKCPLNLYRFWQTTTASTLENGDIEITTTIDGKVKVVYEASIRRNLKLEDSDAKLEVNTARLKKLILLAGVSTASILLVLLAEVSTASRSYKSYAPTSKASLPTRSHATTRHKGKEIAKPITPPSESPSDEDSDPEQAQKDKEMQKNLTLIAKYFKKLYKPTNNNLRTFLNIKNKNVDTTPRYKNDNQTG